ncbi:MAG: hypothetical protein IH958_06065 [Chloroflexi bacterium]|nr:hypothetical protein [Chloroflexota bacterium]
MLFEQRYHDGLVRGEITLTFRVWRRPRVKAGGRYRFGASGVLAVIGVDEVRASEITDRDARRSGFADRESLLDYLRKLQGGSLPADAKLFRVAFRYVARPDERLALAQEIGLSREDVDADCERLRRMDARSAHGPWTVDTLALIEKQPAIAASRLAQLVGRERLRFKADVRKLKNLGLTVSLDVGYEISPRGRVILERLRTR